MSTSFHRRGLGPRAVSEGTGPDVLLIGGLGDEATVWDAQVAALGDRYRLTRYSGRGVGGSPAPPGPYTLTELVEDAVAVLEQAEIGGAHVVGSSLGGAIAQRLAIDYPERVRTLTLSGSWARSDRAFRALLESWVAAAERARGVASLLHTVNRWAYGPGAWNSGAVDDAIAAADAAEIRAGVGSWRLFRDAFVWSAWAALEHDCAERLAEIAVPVLLLVGDQDAVLGERYSRELAALLRDSRLEVIADAGHQPFQEQPAKFNALLGDFLAVAAGREAMAA
jgi:pimeloyl-ACP methyl ester carboxylesterase